MGADLSLWNAQPSGAMNYAGPGVANLNGTSAITAMVDASGGGGSSVPSYNVGSGLCQIPGLAKLAPWLCPGGATQTLGDPNAPVTDASGNPASAAQLGGAAVVNSAIGQTVASIFSNKSLWLLAGMILLFVLIVLVIRR